MQRQQKNWSIIEKQKLNAEAEKFRQNNRINWTLVAEQMHDRTPTQCRLQYRNNNQDREKVNHIWSKDITYELMSLTCVYGKKWTFLQQNYFPNFTVEQLRLKLAQQEQRRTQYSEITRKAESGFELCDKEKQFLKLAHQGLQAIRIRFEEVEVNELGMLQLDPLQQVFYNMLSKHNFIAEQEKRLYNLVEKLHEKSNTNVSTQSNSFQ
ncbi:Conserved_hypothetical protein [Hexamita inflata]|uniref:Myb-like domain-containing protein n=1 Tax=Hexamita inflata TaxID=28002 RepID=A0AA86Q2H2_9EUKA|nr:Conserved hypothetical protein [Hexamita inflata]